MPAIRHQGTTPNSKMSQPEVGGSQLEGDDSLPGDQIRADLGPIVARNQPIIRVGIGQPEGRDFLIRPGLHVRQHVGERPLRSKRRLLAVEFEPVQSA